VQVVQDTVALLKPPLRNRAAHQIPLAAPAVGEEEDAALHPVALELREALYIIHAHREGVRVTPEVQVERLEIDVGHLELDAGGALRPAHRAARLRGEIGLAGGVHDRARQDGLPARLALDIGASHGLPVDDRPRRQTMGEDGHSGLGEHPAQHGLQLLRIHHHAGYLAGGPLGARGADGHQAVHNLLGHSLDDDAPLAIHEVVRDVRHEAGGGHATQHAVALHQDGGRARPGGTQRRSDARYATARHKDVRLAKHGNVPRGLTNQHRHDPS